MARAERVVRRPDGLEVWEVGIVFEFIALQQSYFETVGKHEPKKKIPSEETVKRPCTRRTDRSDRSRSTADHFDPNLPP